MLHNELSMWEKISIQPVTSLVSLEDCLKKFYEDFKKDEDGLEVVQTVLVVLVGVLLIAGLWLVLGPWIKGLWENITQTSQGITGNPFM